MNYKADMIELIAVYAVLVVLSLVGIVWDIWSRLLVSGIDGIFLLLICLSMGGVFSLMMLSAAITAGFIKLPRRSEKKAAEAPTKSAAPAAATPASNPGPKAGGN